ncbi:MULTISPECIES: hypothetical protein [unclassified Microcoleus]|uniref:hypothetical protein n=1 Tax=unclassified Microcoleus TaxID=2642155 RepID=UPI002FD07FC1
MFEYFVMIPSILEEKEVDKDVDKEKVKSMQVAKYNFNLGLQVGDDIELILHYGDECFSFGSKVVKILKVIENDKERLDDIFRIEAHVEILDKEDFVKVREILKGLNSSSRSGFHPMGFSS